MLANVRDIISSMSNWFYELKQNTPIDSERMPNVNLRAMLIIHGIFAFSLLTLLTLYVAAMGPYPSLDS